MDPTYQRAEEAGGSLLSSSHLVLAHEGGQLPHPQGTGRVEVLERGALTNPGLR